MVLREVVECSSERGGGPGGALGQEREYLQATVDHCFRVRQHFPRDERANEVVVHFERGLDLVGGSRHYSPKVHDRISRQDGVRAYRNVGPIEECGPSGDRDGDFVTAGEMVDDADGSLDIVVRAECNSDRCERMWAWVERRIRCHEWLHGLWGLGITQDSHIDAPDLLEGTVDRGEVAHTCDGEHEYVKGHGVRRDAALYHVPISFQCGVAGVF